MTRMFFLLWLLNPLAATDINDEIKNVRSVGYYFLLQDIENNLSEGHFIERAKVSSLIVLYKDDMPEENVITRWVTAKDVASFVSNSKFSVESDNTHQFVSDINDDIKIYNISQKNIDQMLWDWKFTETFWLLD